MRVRRKVSNIPAGNLGLRLAVPRRADLYLSYNIVKDTRDGRVSDSLAQAMKLWYNPGYQYHGYHEEFGLPGDNRSYRAHTGFTSLLWSF